MALKELVIGNELDLSLNELTDVPVKELAATPKATHLDLSCNIIRTLPNDFATLTHLVKIDLSRNKLTELPDNFGNLVNLQYLEIDKNQLKTVPLSFCRLKNLRWLDLKDNPLEPRLKAIAGDCLDEKQCQACAKKVVAYMQSRESTIEREKQKKLKEMRVSLKNLERAAYEKARIQEQLEEQRKILKLEKERRKAESRMRNEEKLKQTKENTEKDCNLSETDGGDDISFLGEKKGIHWRTWLLPLIFMFAAAATIHFFTMANGSPLQNISLSDVKSFVEKHSLRISKISMKYWKSSVIPFIFSVKTSFLRNVHSTMVYISNVASQIELMLSVYF